MNYTVHCFTKQTVGTTFPENTYSANNIEQVTKIIDDCSKEISGIVLLKIYIHREKTDEV